MPTRKHKCAWAAAGCVAAVWALWGCGASGPPSAGEPSPSGADTPEEAFQRFVKAVEDKNEAEFWRSYAGRVVDVELLQTNPELWWNRLGAFFLQVHHKSTRHLDQRRAKITFVRSDNLLDSCNLVRLEGRWYLTEGDLRQRGELRGKFPPLPPAPHVPYSGPLPPKPPPAEETLRPPSLAPN